ncbi:DoxX family protein [Methylocapsa sp. S129]|uniref:DoxX family protein n=1 Tax=Methylocapsa sp. S129 TaxID=1641869 RepID=UPI00131E6E44|nr:DoxX family membrane protein [Methylocapsa sp. S129]
MSSLFSAVEPYAVLRVACGAFLIPHIWGKLQFPPPLVVFFEQAGLRPARAFMILASIIEAIAAAALILNLFTPIAALLAAIMLVIATICLYRVRGFLWIWNSGGFEFPLFWTIVSLVVARIYWI